MIPAMTIPSVIRWLITVRMILSIAVVTSQSNQGKVWLGCINQELNKNQNLVRIQQPTRVCLSVANDTDWNRGYTSYVRASFEPKGDVYSRFHIPNCKSVVYMFFRDYYNVPFRI